MLYSDVTCSGLISATGRRSAWGRVSTDDLDTYGTVGYGSVATSHLPGRSRA
jgi:hypothetical protein